MQGTKQYRAVVRFGTTTDSYDADGVVVDSVSDLDVDLNQITMALAKLQNTIEQVPPPFSAVRVSGRRLYSLARQGIMIEAPPRTIKIYAIDLCSWVLPDLTLEITCSPGTYIRSLAHDLGQMLGVGAHLAALTRTASGDWRVEDSLPLTQLQAGMETGRWMDQLHPLDAALRGFERVDLARELSLRVKQGQDIKLQSGQSGEMLRAYSDEGELLALLEPTDEPGLWHPKKVFWH
jgi:tRNA pseudouridine55 synthase